MSSNDHTIHIHAPSLCTSGDPDAGEQAPTVPEITFPGDTIPLDRSHGTTWKLRAHSANIPSVSFFVSRDDSATVYLVSSGKSQQCVFILLSWRSFEYHLEPCDAGCCYGMKTYSCTDIDYNIWVWNISQGSQLVHHISPSSVENSRQYGWLALPLDIDNFRLVSNLLDLTGFASELDCLEDAVVITDRKRGHPAKLPFPILHTRSQQLSLLVNDGSEPLVSYQSPWRDHERGPPFEGELTAPLLAFLFTIDCSVDHVVIKCD